LAVVEIIESVELFQTDELAPLSVVWLVAEGLMNIGSRMATIGYGIDEGARAFGSIAFRSHSI
jgi:hypothetical protein